MKRFRVEPIMINRPPSWGDINPATKQLEGSYHGKTEGACKMSESTLTEANGFVNITTLEAGYSPLQEIFKRG